MTEKEELLRKMAPVFRAYGVQKAVLFGSYAKGTQREGSDIDLLVYSRLKGLQFVGLMQDIEEAVRRPVDLFDVSHIEPGSLVDREIADTGMVIYEE